MDDKGVQHSVHYIAGPETGYRVLKNVKGPHLPTVFPFSHPNILPSDFYDYIDNKGSDFFDTAESNNYGGGNKGGSNGGGGGSGGSRPNQNNNRPSFGGGGLDTNKDDFGDTAPSAPTGPSVPSAPSRPFRPSRPSRPRPGSGGRPSRPFGGRPPSVERPSTTGDDNLPSFGDLFDSEENGGGGSGKPTSTGGGSDNAYIPPSPSGPSTTFRPSSTTQKPGIFVTPSRPGAGRPGSRPGSGGGRPGSRPGRPGSSTDFLDNDLNQDEDFNLFPSGLTGGTRPTGGGEGLQVPRAVVQDHLVQREVVNRLYKLVPIKIVQIVVELW